MNQTRNDATTIAAIAVIAICLTMVDHEAIGHGGACLALGGRITLLTSSLFRCDTLSIWVSPAGPAMNLFMGALALILSRFAPRGPWKLFLILMTAFSWFWESAYLMQAMLMQKGDLFELLHYYFGDLSIVQRVLFALPGLALFIVTTRLSVNALRDLFGDGAVARQAARTAWVAATVAGLAATLAGYGAGFHGIDNIRDTVLEIGGASFPLLFLRLTSPDAACAVPVIRRSVPILVLTVIVFVTFTLTLGHGYAA